MGAMGANLPTMKKLIFLLAASALAASFVPAVGQTAEAIDCGSTTLAASLIVNEDGTLACGPGEETILWDDLAAADPNRTQNRSTLGVFASIADLQWADEESPLRGEWADKCPPDSPISDSAFRPHETMVGHIANSHVEAINRLAAEGSPILGAPLDLVLTLGDLADNQQFNEIRYFIDLFDGGGLVDPDSGDDPVLDGDGYDGVQGKDPEGSGVPLAADGEGGPPVTDERSLRDLANEPFFAPGLRSPTGPIPWYALPGNHDVKVQGTIFDDNAAWRALVRRHATSHIKLMDLAPDYQARLCESFESQDPAAFQSVMEDILGDPQSAGTTKVVPSDPERLPLYRMDEEKQPGDEEACLALTQNDRCSTTWLEEQFASTGLPAGHGYTPENRCTDAEGNFIPRLCYSFVSGDFLFVGLDTSPPEGLERGSVDQAQAEWLERTLQEHSSAYYDADGQKVSNPEGDDKLAVIFTHHPARSMTNTGLYSSGEERGMPKGVIPGNGAVTEDAFIELLTRYPNVILHSSGHTHENNVWLHENEELGTAYYEVNTASVADMPSESRIFEVADNGDGTLSIFSTIFEAAVAPNARAIHWHEDDATDETELGAAQAVNEHWLASFGREVGYHDPQQNVAAAAGDPEDRNVELIVPAPFDLGSEERETLLTYAGPSRGLIGRNVRASATLTDADGTPLEGMLIRFKRHHQTAHAVTDAAGRAEARLKVTGPRWSKRPLIVTFDGSGIYQPSEISVPFTANQK
jgi:metallophosphoesterase (TIGR03767 family)